ILAGGDLRYDTAQALPRRVLRSDIGSSLGGLFAGPNRVVVADPEHLQEAVQVLAHGDLLDDATERLPVVDAVAAVGLLLVGPQGVIGADAKDLQALAGIIVLANHELADDAAHRRPCAEGAIGVVARIILDAIPDSAIGADAEDLQQALAVHGHGDLRDDAAQ